MPVRSAPLVMGWDRPEMRRRSACRMGRAVCGAVERPWWRRGGNALSSLDSGPLTGLREQRCAQNTLAPHRHRAPPRPVPVSRRNQIGRVEWCSRGLARVGVSRARQDSGEHARRTTCKLPSGHATSHRAATHRAMPRHAIIGRLLRSTRLVSPGSSGSSLDLLVSGSSCICRLPRN